jgi:arginyl-tRNA synthetase
MRLELEQTIAAAIKDLFDIETSIDLVRIDEQLGDYATNVALQIAAKTKQNPLEVARSIVDKIGKDLSDADLQISIAGPGFLNFRLSDQALIKSMDVQAEKTLDGLVIVTEYSDPNPFKVLHAGHLYTSIVGDAVANILENAGAIVHRVNFGGDVGLHVAKNMWAILKTLGGEEPEKLSEIDSNKRADWLSDRYVEGNEAYETDDEAKQAIVNLNKRIYELFDTNDHDSAFAKIYWTCREWSYDYFNEFYKRIGSNFEKYYPESETAPLGIATVREQLRKGVYELSDGAVIFNGEKYGLHTRVFINSQGLPTYEAKDVGLIMAKWRDYKFNRSVIITGNDIIEYMKVVLKSIEQFEPELAKNTNHLTHGIVKLKGGVKMSSRKGNILRAVDVLDAADKASIDAIGTKDDNVTLGAVKYAFLKQRIGGDIVYDPKESVSLEGNSGPYLQYAHARAVSIMQKSSLEPVAIKDLDPAERSLCRKLSEYPEVINQATKEMMPHHVAGYLYELTQVFNSFYEHSRVVGDAREAIRLTLVKTYAQTLKRGLNILGIHAPERM